METQPSNSLSPRTNYIKVKGLVERNRLEFLRGSRDIASQRQRNKPSHKSQTKLIDRNTRTTTRTHFAFFNPTTHTHFDRINGKKKS